jgi:hypothetical protein
MDPDLLIVSGTSYIINNYVFPTTPTVNDIQVEGTVIAQITFLPKNSGGGLVYSKSSLLAPGDQPVTISHALVSISPTEPVLFFSRITDSPVFLQPVRPSTMRSIERPFQQLKAEMPLLATIRPFLNVLPASKEVPSPLS